MKRRSLILVICALALVLAGSAWYFHDKRLVAVITQKQIDEALQSKFPITKKHLLLFQITYSNPHVTFLPETNRIEVGMDAVLNIKFREQSKNMSGTAVATTGLSYRSETYQFFLSEPEIKKLSIQGIPQQYVDKVTSLASNTVSEYLQKHPIYTLKAKDMKTATVKLLLKDVQVKSNEVHATLGL